MVTGARWYGVLDWQPSSSRHTVQQRVFPQVGGGQDIRIDEKMEAVDAYLEADPGRVRSLNGSNTQREPSSTLYGLAIEMVVGVDRMIDEIQSLLEQYRIWLRDKTSIRQVNDWVEITTPYMDRHNDLLQIYAKRSKDGFLLTDDGYILDDLEQSG